MNIMITGVNGFIGRKLALALLEAGHGVCGLDRMDEPFDKRVGYVRADITNPAEYAELFSRFKPEALIHLAALVHKKGADLSLERYRRINATASADLFRRAIEMGVKAIVFSSTIEVYGNPDTAFVDESTPCNPISYYAQSKQEAEQALIELVEGLQSPPRWAILRFAPVYAPEFRLNLDKRFYLPGKKAAYLFRDGSYAFHFCAAGNITDFIVKYVASDIESGVYNIGDVELISAKEFIALERKHGLRRVVHTPYTLSYAAIAAAEFVFRLFSKSEPFLSRYNFKKLFKSIRYDSSKAWRAAGEPRWGMESLYQEGKA